LNVTSGTVNGFNVCISKMQRLIQWPDVKCERLNNYYFHIRPKGLLHNAERDLSVIAKFLVRLLSMVLFVFMATVKNGAFRIFLIIVY